jgi:hypothetical protein
LEFEAPHHIILWKLKTFIKVVLTGHEVQNVSECIKLVHCPT